jgi:Asparagine synthase
MTLGPHVPTELEIAGGIPVGEQRDAVPLPDVPQDLTPRAALEEAIVAALERPPCLVSFSGGRDSSAVLALAAHLARREGLPLPIPGTYRFPAAPAAGESSWQELVVGRLDLPEWIRMDMGEEFDVIGPEASAVLERHGVLVPFSAYAQAPLLREAAGGTLLTGFDGDGLFRGWRWQRFASVCARRERPRPRDLLSFSLAAAPQALRTEWEVRRGPLERLPWLRPDVERIYRREWVRGRSEEPRTWERRVPWYARRRAFVLPRLNTELLAKDAGATLVHPLLAPRFLAALARTGGRWGLGTRTDWMRALFADVLPEQVLARRDKADLEEAFWGEGSRRFAEEWDGSGLDEDLVDVEAVRAAWRRREWLAISLLQVAWLRSRKPAAVAASA